MPLLDTIFGNRCRLCGKHAVSMLGAFAPTHPGEFHVDASDGMSFPGQFFAVAGMYEDKDPCAAGGRNGNELFPIRCDNVFCGHDRRLTA